MSVRRDLEQTCRDHFNEPMLSLMEVVRCIGYGEDERDCYIIYRKMGGAVRWHTCVGAYTWLTPLRGQDRVKGYTGEDWDDLWRLDNTLKLNGCPPEDEFMIQYRGEKTGPYLPHSWMAYKGTTARVVHAVQNGRVALCGRPAKHGFEDRPDFTSKCLRCARMLALREQAAADEGRRPVRKPEGL